ncbi:helix-turn-helix domain-containing protein [Sphingobium fuliginis]|uniref:helix-turn-helix domain-containing protein n=1 Tax=Sphingobium fuliginis (strain ATCC 27551) TaxID=336203 RepID=UPI001021CB65|nr:helix-turn-helix domain-containing protein [Sphingobium fuliginis]RYM01115.1 DNA-binding protein [Sphingobium fuliginis]
MIAPISVRIGTAVRMTGIGRSKLYELIRQGAIDVVKIGSATLIPVASLHRLLERNRR